MGIQKAMQITHTAITAESVMEQAKRGLFTAFTDFSLPHIEQNYHFVQLYMYPQNLLSAAVFHKITRNEPYYTYHTGMDDA